MLIVIVFLSGRSVIPWLLRIVAQTRSRELFTLSILAIALAIALGSSMIFGVSMALGAFLAGMVVGQTEASHQAAADALPMRDAFAVLFFVSVGMLFDPMVVVDQPGLLGMLLFVVLIVNPCTAFFISWLLRYSVGTSLMVAALLSQIGEFSFLLASQAVEEKLLVPEGHSLLVACAIVSIAINPFLFRAVTSLEGYLKGRPKTWSMLSRRSESIGMKINELTSSHVTADPESSSALGRAVIVGFWTGWSDGQSHSDRVWYQTGRRRP